MTRRTRHSVAPDDLTAEDFAYIRSVVEEVRLDAGTGGQCGFVAEILAGNYGWDMHGGIYHSLDGHPIGDHVWNYHPATETIIDATADQFGEGAEVRVLPPGDQTALRYRFATTEEEEEEWLTQARQRRDRDGEYWWMPEGMADPRVLAYLHEVRRYETG